MATLQLKSTQSCILHLQTSITNTTHQIQKSKEILLGIDNPYPSNHAHQSIKIKKQDVNNLHLDINMEVTGGAKGKGKQYPKTVVEEVVINGQKYVKQKLFGRMVESRNVEDLNNKMRIEEENECEESIVQKLDPLNESLKKQRMTTSSKAMVNRGASTSLNKKQSSPLSFNSAFPNRIKRVETQNQEDYSHLTKLSKTMFDLPEAVEHKNLQTNQVRKRSKDRKPIFEKKNSQSEQKYRNENRFKSIQEKLKENERILEGERIQYIKWPKEKYPQKQEQIRQNKSNLKAAKVHTQMTSLKTNHYNPQRRTKNTYNSNNPDNFRTTTKNNHNRSKSHSRSSSAHSSINKLNLLKFYTNGVYYTRQPQPVKCDKFRRQIDKMKRERYMSDALKIPGIDKYFSYSEIYQLYIKFREIGLPQYEWSDFLRDQVRKVGKFMVTEQRFTSI